MDISEESLKLLDSVIFNNPKHSPKGHDGGNYGRWIEFIINNYKNDEYIESWDLYKYFMKNGYENFEDEVRDLVHNYQTILEFINHLIITDDNSKNKRWLFEKFASKL